MSNTKKKTCAVPGCAKNAPAQHKYSFVCQKHWRMVPTRIKVEIFHLRAKLSTAEKREADTTFSIAALLSRVESIALTHVEAAQKIEAKGGAA